MGNDRSLGAYELARAIGTGESVSPQAAMLHAYGIYLSHGGTPRDFMNMTEDDIQIMYTSYTATLAHERNELLKELVKIIQKMFKV